jgi:hypothetical protein
MNAGLQTASPATLIRRRPERAILSEILARPFAFVRGDARTLRVPARRTASRTRDSGPRVPAARSVTNARRLALIRLREALTAQVAFGGAVLDCALLDTSRGGARVHLLAPAEVPETATLTLPGGDCWTVQRRWQRGEEVGFKVVEAGQGNATATGRGVDAIRRDPASLPARNAAGGHRRRRGARDPAVLAVAALHWAAVASLALPFAAAGASVWLGPK